MTQPIMTEIGSGELIDKITILEIKSDRISDLEKLKNVRHELSVLSATRDAHLSGIEGLRDLAIQLKTINEALWEIEDDIRACEAQNDFRAKIYKTCTIRIYYERQARRSKKRNQFIDGCKYY